MNFDDLRPQLDRIPALCSERLALFDPEHVEAGGYRCEDWRGALDFHRLVSLSIGAVEIDPARFRQYQEVAAATEAKRMAKRVEGSYLFVDQRRRPGLGREVANAAHAAHAAPAPERA